MLSETAIYADGIFYNLKPADPNFDYQNLVGFKTGDVVELTFDNSISHLTFKNLTTRKEIRISFRCFKYEFMIYLGVSLKEEGESVRILS